MRWKKMESKAIFNGNTTGTTTHIQNDRIEYCPFCGKKLIMYKEEIKYCPYCGKEIPKTYTCGMVVVHWNYEDGTPSYPRDGIINPIFIC